MQNLECVAVSSITTKGQVTIPAEIRRRLGVGPRDRVDWIVEDGQVRVTRSGSGSVTERTAGALKRHASGKPRTAEALRAADQLRAYAAVGVQEIMVDVVDLD